MSVKRVWKINKIASLPLPPELREDIINHIVRRQPADIKLYAWKIKERIATQAFVTKSTLLGDWGKQCGSLLLRENKTFPSEIKIVEWNTNIYDVIPYIKEGKISKIQIKAKAWKIIDLPVPNSLQEDLKTIAEKPDTK